jgi:hypothetical protein
MILLLLAAQAGMPNPTDMQSSMRPVPSAEAVALFKRVCFDPFPDTPRVLGAIADPALGLSRLPETPSQAMQPGDAWSSATAQITYVDSEWLPRDFGNPQCSLTASLAGNPEHLAVEAEMTAALGLPPGKGGKNKPRGQTEWNLPGRAPDSWRLFMSTTTTSSGKELRATIMNMRGKRK